MSARSVAVPRAAEVVRPPLRIRDPINCDVPLNFVKFDLNIQTSCLNCMCTQTTNVPSFLFFESYAYLCIFLDLDIGHISRSKQKKRPASQLLVNTLSTSCGHLTSKFVILSGAMSIHCSSRF